MTKESREQLIGALIDHAWECMDLGDLELTFKDMMLDGCSGYAKATDAELLEEYELIFDKQFEG